MLSLDGTWRFCPAFHELEANQAFMRKDAVPRGGGDRRDVGWVEPDFDDSGWLQIDVPSTWNKAIPDLWSYEGHGWYRRNVTIPSDWKGKRVEFTCDGANYRTVLYVNGEICGIHEGGYTPFRIPIHRFLRYGEENVLAVSVDNIPSPERCPGGEFGWWNYGGIYRSTGLLVRNHTFLEDITVVSKPSGRMAEIEIGFRVHGRRPTTQPLEVEIEISDSGGAAMAQERIKLSPTRKGCKGRAALPLENPLLWSPDHPDLYQLSVTIRDIRGDVLDHESFPIGIRSVTVKDGQLLLNGEPLLVRGVNRHPDYPLTGHMEREEDLVRDLRLVKQIGANAMRCHYPYSPRTYELCDQMGILCLAEIPLYQWGRPEVKADSPKALVSAKKQLEETIRYLRNHPCVFVWSVSNENMTVPRRDSPTYRKLAKMAVQGNLELVEMAHKLDPSRPVVEASNCWPEDPVLDRTDLCAVNLYIGASTPHIDTLEELSWKMHEKMEALRKRHPSKPILVTEFGSWAIRGLMTDYFPGELYQAALIKNYWEGLLQEENFVGAFIWCFQDSDEHRRWEWDYELRVAYGLFDLYRRPKESARMVKEMWKGSGVEAKE